MVRIAAMAEGEWLPPTPAGASTGGHFDVGLVALAQAYVPLVEERNPAVSDEIKTRAVTQGWLHRKGFGEAPGAAVCMPIIYLPAAGGLAVGRSFGLTVLQSYHMARWGSHLACAVLLGLAVWIWTPPLLAWAILLLPMSLFQMASPVIDGPAHALCVFVLSLFMAFWTRDLSPRPLWVWVWAAGLVVLITARLHLAPLLALPWMLFWKSRSKSWMWVALSCLAVCVMWVIWALTTVVDHRIQRALSTAEIARHYLTHPQEIWSVFERTLSDSGRLEFLATSFIGNLAKLDTRLPDQAYEALGIGLALALAASLPLCASKGSTWPARLSLIGGSVAAVLMSFALMLLSWSPFPTGMVEGVQGRYFIAPALMLAYGVSGFNRPTRINASTSALQTVMLLAFGALSLYYLLPTLLERYPAWARSSVLS